MSEVETPDANPAKPLRAAVVEWMIQYVATNMEVPRETISLEEPFTAYGLDSLELVVMTGLMEDEFHVDLDGSERFDMESIASVADSLTAAGIVRAE